MTKDKPSVTREKMIIGITAPISARIRLKFSLLKRNMAMISTWWSARATFWRRRPKASPANSTSIWDPINTQRRWTRSRSGNARWIWTSSSSQTASLPSSRESMILWGRICSAFSSKRTRTRTATEAIDTTYLFLVNYKIALSLVVLHQEVYIVGDVSVSVCFGIDCVDYCKGIAHCPQQLREVGPDFEAQEGHHLS